MKSKNFEGLTEKWASCILRQSSNPNGRDQNVPFGGNSLKPHYKPDSTSSNSYTIQDLETNSTYTVAVSAYDEAGNESAKSSSITVTTIDPTVGNDFKAEFLGQVKIYPNPIYYQLYIETKDIRQYSIELSSINGQLVYNQEVTEHIHQLDLSSFQKGVYIISIRSKDFVTTRKVIKL